MNHAAKIVHRNPILDNFVAKRQAEIAKKEGKPVEIEPKKDQSDKVDIYDEETKNLRFSIADYYLFSKLNYQLPLVWRALVWELLAIVSGVACALIPIYIYGYGIANYSGKTEDLFTVGFAAYQANVMTHHMQMFVTIRNYTAFFGVTCVISLSFLWPILTVAQNYNFLAEERLGRHIGIIIFD